MLEKSEKPDLAATGRRVRTGSDEAGNPSFGELHARFEDRLRAASSPKELPPAFAEPLTRELLSREDLREPAGDGVAQTKSIAAADWIFTEAKAWDVDGRRRAPSSAEDLSFWTTTPAARILSEEASAKAANAVGATTVDRAAVVDVEWRRRDAQSEWRAHRLLYVLDGCSIDLRPELNASSAPEGERIESAQERRLRLLAERGYDERAERMQADRDRRIAEGVRKGEERLASGKIKLEPQDRAWLEADPRHKELAYDPDAGTFRVQEAKAALACEAQGVLAPPVRRSFQGGSDFTAGDSSEWSHKGCDPRGAVNLEFTVGLVVGEAQVDRAVIADLMLAGSAARAAAREIREELDRLPRHAEVRFLPATLGRVSRKDG